ncbi:MAG: hypothetical protein K6B41_02535 [Butyrivibrio sp.]|nr:hypothetical protein [Butyrivibrio sp.]
MEERVKLTEEQKRKIQQLEYNYKKDSVNSSSLNNDELYSRVFTLDSSLRKKALTSAIILAFTGFILFITGYNLLTKLEHSFLTGVIFFCIGMISMAASYPLYNNVLHRNRKKYAPVVLAITKFLG